MLVLVAVVFGAVWCVDGCMDPTDRKCPLPSSDTYTCTVCVMPFATVPRFSLPARDLDYRTMAEVTIVHLWLAPIVSIDHPPRAL